MFTYVDDQLSTNENLKKVDDLTTANEEKRIHNTPLQLNMIQNILAHDFEVEIINYDPNTFPNPINDPNDDEKPVLTHSNENEFLLTVVPPRDPVFGHLIFETTVGFFC